MREVLRCAYCRRYRRHVLHSSMNIYPGSEGRGRGPKRGRAVVYLGNVWVGCINHNLFIGSSIPLLLSTPTKHGLDIQRAHLSHARASQHQRQPTAACQDIGCKHLASPLHIGWGRGTDPSITDTCHSTTKSCLCCGSLFVASSAIPDRKRPTDDPNAHFPRLSFRTSFSFSPFGFSSVPFVTRY